MPAESRCDVLIVGGGPAGSSCAWWLRRAGLRVVVWDRRAFPRDKVCAGWITPQVAAALDLDLAGYAAAGRTVQPIHGFRLSRLGDRDVRVGYDRAVSCAIRRCEFDDYLLRRSGAELRLGQPVHRLARHNGGWVLNDTLFAPMLVGAGGHFCPVAQHVGAQLGRGEPIVAAQEIEIEMTAAQSQSCSVEAEIPELFFTRDLAGYGWVVRKGRFLNVGLGRQGPQHLGDEVERFMGFLARHGKLPPGAPVKPRGHAYLLYGEAARPLVGDGVLLVGDAAGLAYARSGEGIRPAIESGLMAAQSILECDGTYGREPLGAYERRLTARFGRRENRRGLTAIVPQRVTGSIAGRLLASAWFARHVVLNRWFFHMHQPPLRPGGTMPPAAPAA